MNNEHVTQVMEGIREDCKSESDLDHAIRKHAAGLLNCVCDHPMDFGIRKVRSITFSRQDATRQASGDRSNLYLLVVRGIAETGDDVVSFTGASSPIHALVEYCYKATCDQLAWKADTRNGSGSSRQSFVESLAGE